MKRLKTLPAQGLRFCVFLLAFLDILTLCASFYPVLLSGLCSFLHETANMPVWCSIVNLLCSSGKIFTKVRLFTENFLMLISERPDPQQHICVTFQLGHGNWRQYDAILASVPISTTLVTLLSSPHCCLHAPRLFITRPIYYQVQLLILLLLQTTISCLCVSLLL